MVLEEAARSTESFGTDSPPSDDIDRYADKNPPYTSTREPSFASVARDGAQGKVFVNLANLPRPFSLFGTRSNPPVLIESIQESCRFLQQVLQRPATQEEADAFAYHVAKSYRVASFGSPVGMSLASVQFFRTRDSFRFPGWSPFKDQSNWSKDRLGPLTGPAARMGWHSLRLFSYMLLGSVVGAVFFGSYAVSLSLAGRAMDPRLKEFSEKLRQLQKDGVSTQQLRRQQDVEGTTQAETFEQRRQRRSVQSMQRESGQSQGYGGAQGARKSNDYDDASPTGGAFEADYSDPLTDTGVMNDDQSTQQQYRQQADAWSSPAENRANTVDLNKAAPQRPSADRQAANQGEGVSQQQGGSAWERLRQQAANGGAGAGAGSGAQRRSRDQEDQGGDAFSFSSSEEDKQTAKYEAQKDFDARIEQERSGKNFDSKRW
ncbi:hypothetical protein WHR41_03219 [Cladosporium halotolerans]|uniref:Uncharacterized protein n=1 Tax=Cladosporium halotolerans TaxID=1052096 RepID=A0AB34KTD2_9PEZI